MDKEELMKINKEYIDHLKAMESLAERMDRNYLYMDNFGLFCFFWRRQSSCSFATCDEYVTSRRSV